MYVENHTVRYFIFQSASTFSPLTLLLTFSYIWVFLHLGCSSAILTLRAFIIRALIITCVKKMLYRPPALLANCSLNRSTLFICCREWDVRKWYSSLGLTFFICDVFDVSITRDEVCESVKKSNNVFSPSPSLCCCCWMTWGGWGSVWPMGVSVVAG